jgi:hypothetical protein
MTAHPMGRITIVCQAMAEFVKQIVISPRAGTLTALGKEHLPIGEAVGFQAHRNVLRQTRSELLLSPVPRCRRGILALIN